MKLKESQPRITLTTSVSLRKSAKQMMKMMAIIVMIRMCLCIQYPLPHMDLIARMNY